MKLASVGFLAAILLTNCYQCWAGIGCCSSSNDVCNKSNNSTITDEIYFDIKVEGKVNESWTGRFVVGVFGAAVPITAYNFIALAKGFHHYEETLHYKGTWIERIVPDFLVQMGDITFNDGTGGKSIYAPYFIDESFFHSHRSAGYVAMANSGTDTNASQFYITLTKSRWLDNKNVIFGKIIKGMDIIKRLAELKIDENGSPLDKVYISDCGVSPLKVPYELSEEDLDKNGDVRPGPTAPDFIEL